ncbi:MAG TPA: helix-turn-helix transcriptional regulator [Candidatus Acidoferrum sp.]|nr:helix-turn-helix transcriptional regulator [Candidatus Acidoferrum sp.]
MLLHDQLKQRRKTLGLQQSDMKLRIGMNQQQYQRIEADGNPRLETLGQIADGLDAALVLVPKARLAAVLALLDEATPAPTAAVSKAVETSLPVDADPWAGILGQAAR